MAIINCEHPKDVQNVDLATGELFCGDCSDVIEAYANQSERLAGDDAAAAIAAHLKREGTIKVGSVTVYGVTAIAAHSFDVTARVSSKEETGFKYYVVDRDPLDPAHRLQVRSR
jgi:hypothetical protein